MKASERVEKLLLFQGFNPEASDNLATKQETRKADNSSSSSKKE